MKNKFILYIIPMLVLNSCFGVKMSKIAISNILVPKTVIIDKVKYRNGFYGELYPINLTYKDETYKVGFNEFRRINCEQFDLVHSNIGETTEGVLYCAEDQWKQAYAYYDNPRNYFYYYSIVAGYGYTKGDLVIDISISIDPKKFEELMEFAKNHSYNPFKSDENVKIQRLPLPDKDKSPRCIFYKESKDGYFTSYKGYYFHIIDGKLMLVYYYDYGHGEYEELVAVAIPNDIGQHFIELMKY
ncbi:hypothetical protein FACS1894172_11120 [Spirochaetia bacterium]|nr:hypothetical protein FACS1894164_21120 [Spirochaetia bacterium]GHU33151.1 hypothetical protein FACS1894172_11120 [Spirochaetia bacterium]